MKNIIILMLFVITTQANAFYKGSKEEACKRVVDKIMITWTENCDLSKLQQVALYELLMKRQEEIYLCRKSYVDDKQRQQEEARKIREAYLPDIEKVVGRDNVIKMNKHWGSQVGVDMRALNEVNIEFNSSEYN